MVGDTPDILLDLFLIPIKPRGRGPLGAREGAQQREEGDTGEGRPSGDAVRTLRVGL